MAKDYLRNRPFLTVSFLHRPHSNVNTSVKGWANMTGAMQTFEQVSFVDRINDVTQYGVVIDIINSAVLRNTTPKTSDEIAATYLGKYRDDVSKALTVWAHREAKRMAEEEVAAGGAATVAEIEQIGQDIAELAQIELAPECNVDQCETCQDDPTCHKVAE